MPVEVGVGKRKIKCYTLWESLAIDNPVKFLFECTINMPVDYCEQIVFNVMHLIPREKLEKLKLIDSLKNVVEAELMRRDLLEPEEECRPRYTKTRVMP